MCNDHTQIGTHLSIRFQQRVSFTIRFQSENMLEEVLIEFCGYRLKEKRVKELCVDTTCIDLFGHFVHESIL